MDEKQIMNTVTEVERKSKEVAESYVCMRCKVPLIAREVNFSYLGHPFHAKIPSCPVCGNVMIDETLVKGKITEVETVLEDK